MVDVSTSKGENHKLRYLNDQLNTTSQDLSTFKIFSENLKKTREEKFREIDKNLENIRISLDGSSDKVNSFMQTYNSNLEDIMNELKDYLLEELDNERNLIRKRFQDCRASLKDIEDSINEMRQNREDLCVISLDKPFTVAKNMIEEDRQDRINSTKIIYKYIDDMCGEIHDSLDENIGDRQGVVTNLKERVKQDLKAKDHQLGALHDLLIQNFQMSKDGIVTNMDDRFDAQNEIIESISKMLKTFQNTLRILATHV